MPDMVGRLRAWLRYRGWRNIYWREDWAHATCLHVKVVRDMFPVYPQTTTGTSTAVTTTVAYLATQRICVDCGAVL